MCLLRAEMATQKRCLMLHTSKRVAHSLVLKSPDLLKAFSLPVKRDAGPLNSCLVLKRRLTSLQGYNCISKEPDVKALAICSLHFIRSCQ